ncbi:hypothetical protein V6N11_058878 [Hibiscus sabdariffa]|uniref:Uncharacterized protein n=1 Tax=Hibiscus sabdariffa TaxID=183260 RepID=A0ABR2U5J4_9ROSI
MAASSTLIKIFFNAQIRRMFEENLSSRPFIFKKPFDLKNEANLGFIPEFLEVLTKDKWESFVQQKGEIYPNLTREFYVHLVTKDSLFLMIQGVCVHFDEGYINSMFNLVFVKDEHDNFINSMTTAK